MPHKQQKRQTGGEGLMQALVYHGPGEMRHEMVERPPAPGADEVLVRVKAVGICGSDVHGYTGTSGRRTPGMVMGHELAGAIAEVGDEVDGLRPGDRVTVNPLLYCDRCDSCSKGNEQTCRNRRTIGVNMGKMGGFAEYVVAPARNCVPLSDDVSFEEGMMVEPLAVGLHAARIAAPDPGQPMLILGGGCIGLCVLLACLEMDARPIYVTDLVPHKLDMIARMGGNPLDANSINLAAFARAATAGSGFPTIIDAVADSTTIKQAVPALAPGGTLVLVGLARPTIEFALYDLVTQERSFKGSYAFSADEFWEAAEWINSRRVDVRPLLEATCSLAEATSMFDRKAAGEVDAVKIVVEL
ncbi:MAG: alcohol dehydrogenase catalytic domain-containing protein [Chloroflexota bacterium]|nr:alcohol dehydrogenase catalytic domain-containing protein [Chloroflexota bacterium]